MKILDLENNTELPDKEALSSLSKEELIEKITELIGTINGLNERIKELTSPPPNDWHSWFYILLNIILHKFKEKRVKIMREVVLGAMPPRADFIVVEEGDIIDLGLDVFRFFRKFNILEFKNPDDELSESILWKVVGYAGFFIEHFSAPAQDLTLTLFRGAKPVKLLKELGDCVKEDAVNGIYHIENWKVDFPIQIVVTTELEGEEYAAFRTISKKPSLDDIQSIIEMAEKETDPEMRALLRDFLEMLAKLDDEVLEEAKRRNPEMARTWRDIFEVDQEISNARADERANTTRTNLFNYVQKGGMTIDFAAREANLTTDQFRKQMEEYNRSRNLQTV